MPYEKEVNFLSNFSTADLITEGLDGDLLRIGLKDGQKVSIAGIIAEKKNKVTKNNNMMAFITLEDLYGSIECIIFPATYEKNHKFIEEDKIILLEGRLSISEVEEPKIIAEKISPITKLDFTKLYLKLSGLEDTINLGKIKEILAKYSGETPVYVYFEKEKKTISADRNLWIDAKEERVIEELHALLGKESVKLSI